MKLLLVLAAALLPAAFAVPSVAGSKKTPVPLLVENSRPPNFTLRSDAVIGETGEQPKTVALHSFLGRRRIILLFAPMQSYLETIPWREFAERDLVVLAILRPSDNLSGVPAARPLSLLRDEDGRVFHNYRAVTGRPTFYLIGKDGTIKMARQGEPTNRELFGLIDAMPMRRQEMQERREKGVRQADTSQR